MDCSPPASSIHGIFQARILEWVSIFLLKGIFLTQGLNARIQSLASPALPSRSSTTSTTRKALCFCVRLLPNQTGIPSPIFWHWVVVRESAGAYWKASDKEHGQLMLKKPELPGGRRAGSQGEWSYESQENFKRAEIMRNATYPQIVKKMCPLNVASWMWLLVEFHPY